VRLELTDDQELFRETTRRFLETRTPLLAVRELYESKHGFEQSMWREAAQLGWTSLFVPEALGGGNVSAHPTTDAAIVAEEMGRLVAPGPFLAVNLVAAAVASMGSDEQQASVLPGLVAGEEIATWAFCEPRGQWVADAIATTACVDGDEIVLDGTKAYVEALASAHTVLVAARTGSGLTHVLVPTTVPGVTISPGRSIDMTRRFGRVTLDSVRLPITSVVGPVGEARDEIGRLLRIAIALQSAELVGVADRALEFTMEYGRDRFAFGRPIVSFQALKHRIADMTVRIEASKAITDALVTAIDLATPDSTTLASVTKAYVGQHCADVVDDCVQITGGLGVTWEHDIHLYNRRAALARALYGTPEEHKRRLAAHLEGARNDCC
jgi:alkylation response protein AidB-like acyl-CoA dehydrogenase